MLLLPFSLRSLSESQDRNNTARVVNFGNCPEGGTWLASLWMQSSQSTANSRCRGALARHSLGEESESRV